MPALKKPKILITGVPGCGKTTLIKKVIDKLNLPVCGFITREIRKSGARVGFEVETLGDNPKKAVLSHIDIKSDYHIGRYNVDVETLEKLTIANLEEGMDENKFIVIDEIGKMELLSEKFRDVIIDVFDSDNAILASIMLKAQPFCDKLKAKKGVKCITVDHSNRNKFVDELVNIFTTAYQ